jgi:uncharacterized protein YjdB
VSDAGVVTAVAPGSTHINATIDNVHAQATVEVSLRAVAAVSVDPAQLTLLVGETGNLTVTARDAAGEEGQGRQDDEECARGHDGLSSAASISRR